MATADEVALVAAVLARAVPAGADVGAIGVRWIDGGLQVAVTTSDPGRLIGRRGATADAIRQALADEFGGVDVQLEVHEAQGPPPPQWPPYDEDGPPPGEVA
jgi:ribosomal protein S3